MQLLRQNLQLFFIPLTVAVKPSDTVGDLKKKMSAYGPMCKIPKSSLDVSNLVVWKLEDQKKINLANLETLEADFRLIDFKKPDMIHKVNDLEVAEDLGTAVFIQLLICTSHISTAPWTFYDNAHKATPEDDEVFELNEFKRMSNLLYVN